MKELYRFRQFLAEGVIKEEQMGSYGKFLKVVKSYEDEEILSDFLDSYPKGQDISKSEYERFTEKHLGLSDPEDYRGENWKYIMSEGVTADEITSRVRKLGKEKGIEDKYIEDYIDELDGNFEPDAYENSTDKDLLDDLKSYIDLSEGVIKENIMVSPIIMFGGKKYIEDVISSPDDFGFDKDDAEWVKNNILSSPKRVSIQDYMDLDDKWVKQAQIDTSGGGALDHVVDGLKIHVKQELITPEQEKEAMKVVGLSEGVIKEEQYSGAIIRKGSSDKAKEDTKIVRQALKKAGIKFTNRGEFGMNFKDADLAQIKKVIAGEKVGEFVVSRDVNEGVIKEDYKNDYANSEEDFTDEMVVQKIKDIIKYHELDPQDLIDEIRIEFGVDAMD